MRARTVYRCQQCDYQAPGWLGRCPECGGWASLLEQAADGGPGSDPVAPGSVRALPFRELPSADGRRQPTGIAELDRVLGGGLVPGAVVLLGGEPGIGKSTLLLQAAAAVAEAGRPVLYVTGEESTAQIKLRGERLGVAGEQLWVLAEIDVERVVQAARTLEPTWVVVDSAQAMRCAELTSLPGSVSQVREVAARFVGLAKATGIPVALVGHVTKDGALAGPRALEHVVDTVLHFEGDRHHAFRLVRAVKNRFGPAGELGVFAMGERGLHGVSGASEFFLAERAAGCPGSAVCATLEGSRPVLVEIQALVGESVEGTPRRTCVGVDPLRLAMVLAVLERRAGIDLANRDVFVNVAGGISVDEPAADLAIAAAVVSSAADRAPLGDRVLLGEVGLTGEIRSVGRLPERLREAQRLHFTDAVVPAAGLGELPRCALTLQGAARLDEALGLLFPTGSGAEVARGARVRSGSRRRGGRASAPGAPTGT